MSKEMNMIGRYRIEKEIGRGGMGVVFLAVDDSTRRKVALKTIVDASARELNCIRREIHALSRLHHPGIINILDEGVDSGRPWFAMKLLKGRTLNELNLRIWQPFLDAPPEIRPPAAGHLKSIVAICLKICDALAYIHGEGMVHRDLNPDNIFILPDDQPILMDFGLVSRYGNLFNRQSVDTSRLMIGTINYMAPEQIRGDLVDARADIYSLGCIFYELFSGSVPFSYDDLPGIYKEKISEDILPVDRIVPEIPVEISELIAEMMRGDPACRLGYAEDVTEVFQRVFPDLTEKKGLFKYKSYLYRSGFFGRDLEFRDIDSRLTKAAAGQGGIVLISGESGSGKSRFLVEVGRFAERFSFCVMTGSGQSVDAFEPISDGLLAFPLANPLQRMADILSDIQSVSSIRWIIPYLRILSGVTDAFSKLTDFSTSPEPPDLPADAARIRLMETLCNAFIQFTRHQPVVLMIDDLHWADDITFGFLEHLVLSGKLKKSRLLVLACFCIGDKNDRIDRLGSFPEISCLQLGPLNTHAATSIMHAMLASSDLDKSFQSMIHAYSEGNPFYISEYLKSAVDQGFLCRDRSGKWVSSKKSRSSGHLVSGNLNSMIRKRLEYLDPRALKAAQVGSVIGREMPLCMMEELLGIGELNLIESTHELLARGVWEESSPGQIQFVHDRVRQIAYDSLGADEKIRIHSEIARYLIERYEKSNQSQSAGTIAFHLEKSLRPDESAKYNRIAGEEALSRYDLKNAGVYLEKALSQVKDLTEDRILLRITYANRVADKQGSRENVMRHLEIAQEESEKLGFDRGLAKVMLLKAAFLLGSRSSTDILELLESAQTILNRLEDKEGLVKFLNLKHIVLISQERLDEARTCLDRAIELAESIHAQEDLLKSKIRLIELMIRMDEQEAVSDLNKEILDQGSQINNPLILADVYLGLGQNYIRQGKNIREAKEFIERALQINIDLGRRQDEAICLNHLSLIEQNLRNLDRAMQLCERALFLNRLLGERKGMASNYGNLAIIHCQQGDFVRAIQSSSESLRIFTDLGDLNNQRFTITQLATAYYYNSELGKARDLYLEALRLHEAANDNYLLLVCTMNLAGIMYDLGELDQAGDFTFQAVRYIEKKEKESCDMIQVYMNAALYCRIVLGDFQKALEYIGKAIDVSDRLQQPCQKTWCLFEMAQIHLAMGIDLAPVVEELQRNLDIQEIGQDPMVKYRKERLERAVARHAAGAYIFRGDHPASLSWDLVATLKKRNCIPDLPDDLLFG